MLSCCGCAFFWGRVAVLLCGLPLFQKLLELALALVSL